MGCSACNEWMTIEQQRKRDLLLAIVTTAILLVNTTITFLASMMAWRVCRNDVIWAELYHMKSPIYLWVVEALSAGPYLLCLVQGALHLGIVGFLWQPIIDERNRVPPENSSGNEKERSEAESDRKTPE